MGRGLCKLSNTKRDTPYYSLFSRFNPQQICDCSHFTVRIYHRELFSDPIILYYPFSLFRLLDVTPSFEGISPTSEQVLVHYSPVRHGSNPFDLHVLGTPPAFILSHDQTLIYNLFEAILKIRFKHSVFWSNSSY